MRLWEVGCLLLFVRVQASDPMDRLDAFCYSTANLTDAFSHFRALVLSIRGLTAHPKRKGCTRRPTQWPPEGMPVSLDPPTVRSLAPIRPLSGVRTEWWAGERNEGRIVGQTGKPQAARRSCPRDGGEAVSLRRALRYRRFRYSTTLIYIR